MPTFEQIFPVTEYAESGGLTSVLELTPESEEGETAVLQIELELIPESFAIGMKELEDGFETDF